jgi:hypothetical protein
MNKKAFLESQKVRIYNNILHPQGLLATEINNNIANYPNIKQLRTMMSGINLDNIKWETTPLKNQPDAAGYVIGEDMDDNNTIDKIHLVAPVIERSLQGSNIQPNNIFGLTPQETAYALETLAQIIVHEYEHFGGQPKLVVKKEDLESGRSPFVEESVVQSKVGATNNLNNIQKNKRGIMSAEDTKIEQILKDLRKNLAKSENKKLAGVVDAIIKKHAAQIKKADDREIAGFNLGERSSLSQQPRVEGIEVTPSGPDITVPLMVPPDLSRSVYVQRAPLASTKKNPGWTGRSGELYGEAGDPFIYYYDAATKTFKIQGVVEERKGGKTPDGRALESFVGIQIKPGGPGYETLVKQARIHGLIANPVGDTTGVGWVESHAGAPLHNDAPEGTPAYFFWLNPNGHLFISDTEGKTSTSSGAPWEGFEEIDKNSEEYRNYLQRAMRIHGQDFSRSDVSMINKYLGEASYFSHPGEITEEELYESMGVIPEQTSSADKGEDSMGKAANKKDLSQIFIFGSKTPFGRSNAKYK